MTQKPTIIWNDLAGGNLYNRIVRLGSGRFQFEHRHTDAMGDPSWDHGRADVTLESGCLPVWMLRSVLERLYRQGKRRRRN